MCDIIATGVVVCNGSNVWLKYRIK